MAAVTSMAIALRVCAKTKECVRERGSRETRGRGGMLGEVVDLYKLRARCNLQIATTASAQMAGSEAASPAVVGSESCMHKAQHSTALEAINFFFYFFPRDDGRRGCNNKVVRTTRLHRTPMSEKIEQPPVARQARSSGVIGMIHDVATDAEERKN